MYDRKTWFIVIADHVDIELEDIIETHQGFAVVAVPEGLLPDQANDSS